MEPYDVHTQSRSVGKQNTASSPETLNVFYRLHFCQLIISKHRGHLLWILKLLSFNFRLPENMMTCCQRHQAQSGNRGAATHTLCLLPSPVTSSDTTCSHQFIIIHHQMWKWEKCLCVGFCCRILCFSSRFTYITLHEGSTRLCAVAAESGPKLTNHKHPPPCQTKFGIVPYVIGWLPHVSHHTVFKMNEKH